MKLKTLVLGLGMLASAFSFSLQSAMASVRGTESLEKRVKHELNMLPYANAFDYMTFTVDADNSVTLSGEVTNPVLKSDAGNVVKRIEGVEHVNNQIKVLPVSFFDNGSRLRLYRAIYGHVTLMGVVDSEMDKNIAGLRANGVPGIFSVDNQLKVVRG